MAQFKPKKVEPSELMPAAIGSSGANQGLNLALRVIVPLLAGVFAVFAYQTHWNLIAILITVTGFLVTLLVAQSLLAAPQRSFKENLFVGAVVVVSLLSSVYCGFLVLVWFYL